MRLEKTWPSWTLAVHLAWRQIIPAKNYTPETKYNSKLLRLPTTKETGHTTLELSHDCLSGPNQCTKTNVWLYSPMRILFQHMWLGCSTIPSKIFSHVKLMYLHSVQISWLISLVISWLNYLLFPTSATHNIIVSIDEVGRKVTQLNVDCTKSLKSNYSRQKLHTGNEI